MALTEPQKIVIAQILGITPTILNLQIDALTISADLELAIEQQVELWTGGVGTKTTKIHPRERNYGVETRPDLARRMIIERIAYLLERPDWAMSNGVQIELVRG